MALILQRQIIENPTPTLTLPLKGRGFYGVFSLHGGDFMGFSHFHGSFSNPSPFKGEVRRGMGYICRCSINPFSLKGGYGMNQYIHAVPNFSEGARPEVVEKVVDQVRDVSSVKLIGYFPDRDFNRTVVELIGKPGPLKEALLNMAAKAIELIDMEKQRGSHPRIGAQDTIPIFPLRNITLEDCVKLAEEIGNELNRRTGVPIYFAGENARSPERKALDFIRKGQYEGLRDLLFSEKPDSMRLPDIGDVKNFIHRGATIVSAGTNPLVAVNFILNTDRLDIAQQIAKAVRGPSGGFSTVRSVGLKFSKRNQVVVSMNMFDHEATPLYRTFNLVKTEAARWGVALAGTQLIGTVPQEALIRVAEYFLQIEDFDRNQIRENHIPDLL